ncbi:MAG: thioredoxin-like domain-containing protein [Candidatus Thiodiazotropha sp. L084R]
MNNRESMDLYNLLFYKLFIISLVFVLVSCSAEPPQFNNEHKDNNSSSSQKLEFAPGLAWLNVSRPLLFDDLLGKVVILDFWTYGCINCVHVLADLKQLEKKYGDQLLVIGVHTPKFDNEKNLETLRNIVVRYGIDHPVVNDIDSTLARVYGMRAWPTRVVINPAGEVLGKVTGEGKYDLFDQTINKLLTDHKAILNPSALPLQLERQRFDASLLAAPGKIATSNNMVVISDTLHNRIILTDHQGVIRKIIGGKTEGYKDGHCSMARFNMPQGVAITENGIYIADTGNHLIRYIDIDECHVKTIAGNGTLDRKKEGKFDALSVGLASPWALATQGDRLYIAMAGSHQIWLYNIMTEKIGPYAGSGREGIDDGPLKNSTFSQPSGLSISGDWLYIADAEDSAIRRIQIDDKQVETVVGTGLFDFGDRDGKLHQAKLQHVLGIAAHSENILLIADTYNHKVKSIDLNQGTIKTVVGDGQPGNSRYTDTLFQLNEPGGLAILGEKLLVADTNNHRIISYDLTTNISTIWPISEKEQPANHSDNKDPD